MKYAVQNSKYETDSSRGHPHGPNQPRGSVFPTSINKNHDDGATLWLEYVREIRSEKQSHPIFWLMWYDADGNPPSKVSSVFDIADMKSLTEQLWSFTNEGF